MCLAPAGIRVTFLYPKKPVEGSKGSASSVGGEGQVWEGGKGEALLVSAAQQKCV